MDRKFLSINPESVSFRTADNRVYAFSQNEKTGERNGFVYMYFHSLGAIDLTVAQSLALEATKDHKRHNVVGVDINLGLSKHKGKATFTHNTLGIWSAAKFAHDELRKWLLNELESKNRTIPDLSEPYSIDPSSIRDPQSIGENNGKI